MKACNKARADCHLSSNHARTYQIARNHLDAVTRKAKEVSWQEYVSQLDPRQDRSRIWKTIAAMDGRKPKAKSGSNIHLGEKIAITDQQKANVFIKSYYQESQIKTNKWQDKPRIHAERRATEVNCSNCEGKNTEMCCPFNMAELRIAMTKLKKGKSPGIDKIPNEMLLKLSERGTETLLRLYNLSWDTKTCPNEWKQAEIIAITKPGKDPSITTSYRPISLLSCISKLMERIVQTRLQDFLERNSKLHPAQAGFRKGRSTNEQIVRLTQTIVDGIQNQQRSITTYVDFTKAYDKVWRSNLWGKMGELGIPTCVVRWTKALLSDRYAHVRYNEKRSNKMLFKNGLPQGSVLAPILWLIYINDLGDALPTNTQIGISDSLFADDVAITATAKTAVQCERLMQIALNALEKWADDNKVEISICDSEKSKTVCCLYTKDPSENKGKLTPNLYLKGIKVHHTTTPKFLGVYIDQQLTFKRHAEYVAEKVTKRNKILRSLSGRKWGQSSKQLRNVHCTYTQSAIDHGLGAWGTMAAPSNLDIVGKKERAAARIITGCLNDTPINPLMCEAGLQPIEVRSKLQATLQHEKTTRLPKDTPSHITATNTAPMRLKTRSKKNTMLGDKLLPPRETAWYTLCKAKLECTPKENVTLFPKLEPWKWETPDIEFNYMLDGCMGKNDSDENITNAAQNFLEKTRPNDIVCYTDGSAVEGTKNGGAGAVIQIPNREKIIITKACGTICSSYRAEMIAIEQALTAITKEIEKTPEGESRSLWIITDSQSSIVTIKQGPGNQFSEVGNNIWELLNQINQLQVNTKFQWIPGHKGIQGNEEADEVAGKASKMPQEEVPIDFETAKTYLKRNLRDEWLNNIERDDLFYSKVTGARPKPVPPKTNRADEVLIHQLRTGKSPIAAHCLAKYLNLPDDKGLCLAGCGAKETVEHLLLCPIYAKQREEICETEDPVKVLLNKNPVKILEFLRRIGRRAAPNLQ